jgi:sarcosine oxidase subunit beta
MGAGLDGYNSYSQRGTLPAMEEVIEALVELFPAFGRVRQMRKWAGVMDMSMDGSPIIGKTALDNLYLNAGWCYGGFKATPGSGWVFAYTITEDRPHALNDGFSLERFATGHTIDERGAGPTPGYH